MFKIGDKVRFKHKRFAGSKSCAHAAHLSDIAAILIVDRLFEEHRKDDSFYAMDPVSGGLWYKICDFELVSDTPLKKLMRGIAEHVV